MNTKHTPGPWRVSGTNVRSDFHINGDGALLFVARLPFADVNSAACLAEQAANLLLVGAAPQLLAVLEEIAHHLERDTIQGNRLALAAQAREAVSKARSGS